MLYKSECLHFCVLLCWSFVLVMIRLPPRSTRPDTPFPYTTLFRSRDSAAAPAVLSYLFHRIAGRLDGSPTLIIIDEGWLALGSPAFAKQLSEWLVTLRKKNASVIFATHSLAQLEGSTIAPAILVTSVTRRVGQEFVSQWRSQWEPHHTN